MIPAEEWQTADALIRLSDLLSAADLHQRSLLFWNANNTKSFHRVDWPRLNHAAQLTTVSRYMKHLMRHGASIRWSFRTASHPHPLRLSIVARPRRCDACWA